MNIGKVTNGELSIIKIDESELESKLNDGYELICETEKPFNNAVCSYIRISNGWIENWQEPIEEDSVISEDDALLQYVNDKTNGSYADLGEAIKDLVINN